ncbi:MAG: UDP-N-acetylglucosamine 2-epimerase (non-hydrolyzing) [Candidatus Eisenbacteria bacterium]|uniref:UDP-N-acetylglucosamine 2-epimerase (Non-hydrolyzing) n=1 Tax=Eiseniibacteriota bacterium TaxID=2212470 RepID=A0A956N8A3_UNCEI|nr:UDP-N-acetylglucosamine 2-epimerase (non-hydrolyzing) [Candidatus Eisenbacteria bacterium]MCB9463012.1 UDP-N-acetylglucosamine 2-epimerase (non-hydrolyzing) [Candidatus Eisenbacteria bacterium]
MTRACEVLAVVGARPNFMKVAPILHAAEGVPSLRFTLAHTGQHYDAALSDQFFRELGMREPDVHLKVGSASHAVQTARILERFEEVLLERRPDLVLVAGDVNSTLGCSLAAVKLGIPVAHVEAGLRSGDRTMPEEINRIVTDSVSDLLLTTSRDADDNLEQEGVPSDLIHFVGNTMIDTLRKFEDAARKRKSCESHGAREGEYALVTLHRPSNVDDEAGLVRVLDLLATLSGRSPVLLPLHPRTEASLARHGLAARLDQLGQVKRLPPLGYLDFLSLMVTARLVLTDSGGVQEETTALGVPCFTLRPSTERPVTVTSGTNLLVSDRIEEQTEAIDAFLSGRLELSAKIPELWDGAAGPRIVRVLEHWSESGRPSRVRP